MDLTEARAEIAAADRELAALFLRRMAAVKAAAAWKQAHGLPVYDPEQERSILRDHAAWIRDPALLPYYLRFQQTLMDLSKDYQFDLRTDREGR